MRLLPSYIRISIVPCLLVAAAILLLQQPAPAALGAPAVQTADLPVGGFVADGGAVGAPAQTILTPSLAIRAGQFEPWVAVVQNNRIVVNKFVSATATTSATWQAVDGILNRGSANVAAHPSLDFAGVDRATPWVAWRETVDSLHLLNAAFFNGSSWTLTPLLNRDTTHNADDPALTAGAVVSGAVTLPWVAWSERDAAGIAQLVVSRAEADSGAQGGFRWQSVGNTLNVDGQRNGTHPDLAFAGAGHTVPWVVWRESGAGRASRVFAKQLVGNTWQLVGRQENCGANEVACALNGNADQDAQMARIAAGALPNEGIPSPWVVFAETTAATSEIRVMRLDSGDANDPNDDRFVPVGGAVNSQCLGGAGLSGLGGAMPDLIFVGNVPHVSWVEEQRGQRVLYVCHLADARSGLERWDLDSMTGINTAAVNAAAPRLASNGVTPYVAWQEQSEPTSVHVAHRYPAGPAWAANFPATLQVIAGARLTAAEVDAIAAELGAALGVRSALAGQTFLRSPSVNLTTAAYHVNGATHLEEIWLELTHSDGVAFLARYVVAENKVYVQDPDQPGVFLPGVTIGAGAPNLFTRFVTLEAPKVKVITHGASSPTLEVQWSLIFEDAAFFQTYTQGVKIVYDGGQTTDFFKVGAVFVGSGVYLPLITQ